MQSRESISTTGAHALLAFTAVAMSLVASVSLLSAGPSLTAALTLLGAVTIASLVGLPREAAARLAAAVLLVLADGQERLDVLRAESPRQQDPSTPGRPQPRAPGAAPLPLTA